MLARSWKWVLLACGPIAIASGLLHAGAVPVFLLSALAIIPLAALIGESTGHLSERLGPSSGALINATFGNLAEMIIAVFAVREARVAGVSWGRSLWVAAVLLVAGAGLLWLEVSLH